VEATANAATAEAENFIFVVCRGVLVAVCGLLLGAPRVLRLASFLQMLVDWLVLFVG
jgi:hypothetical protein